MPKLHSVASLSLIVTLGLACGDSESSSTGAGGSGAAGAEGPGGSDTGGMGASGGGGAAPGGGGTGGVGPVGGGGSGGTGGSAMCATSVTNIPIENQECDLFLQDCPVATDTCEVSQVSADPYVPGTACVTKNGLKGIGESCANQNDCEAKLTCVGNYCTPFCCDGDDAVCEGGACDLNVTLLGPNMEDSEFQFWACSFAQQCDLFDPGTCPPAENCYLTNDPGVTACYQPSDVPEVAEGATCNFLNDCLDSSICIGPNDMGVCRYLCDVNAPGGTAPGLGGCPAGQLCDTNSLDTGFAGVGFCHP